MNRVLLADPLPAERSALRILLQDLHMEVVCEASNWLTLYSRLPRVSPDMILLSWDILPRGSIGAIDRLHTNCPAAKIIAIVNHKEEVHESLKSVHVDAFISKEDSPLKVSEILKTTLERRDFSQY